MSFRNLLDNKANVQRYTKGAADGQGGYADGTWSTVFWNVPCRFEQIDMKEGARLTVEYMKRTVYPEFFIYLESRGIKEGDKFVANNGQEYIVVLVRDWSQQGKYMRLPALQADRLE